MADTHFAWPAGIGAVLAVIVLLLAILLALGVLPMNAQTVGGMLAALAVARLT